MSHADEQAHRKPAKILWTGGWDSTFQLLRILLLNQRPVEPYYLIDEDRPSTGTELQTMKRIRRRIRELEKPAADLLRPTQYFSVSQIPENSKITRAYNTLREKQFIGGQYDWLARYCQSQAISHLQLCIHEDDKAAAIVGPILAGPRPDQESPTWGREYLGSDEHLIFRWFEFPVMTLTKTDMLNLAKQHGWSEIMNMTWFCHQPWNGKPCGSCNPCRYTIEEGLGWRIPLHRRVIGNLHACSIRPVKALARTIRTKLEH